MHEWLPRLEPHGACYLLFTRGIHTCKCTRCTSPVQKASDVLQKSSGVLLGKLSQECVCGTRGFILALPASA